MSSDLIIKRLQSFSVKTNQEREMSLKEITQELILLSLSRSGFFDRAAFQGGTCLRIVHGLPRFSEDLDFIASKPSKEFTLQRELTAITDDLSAYGYEIQIRETSNTDSAVKAAFLRDTSVTKILNIKNTGGEFSKITIKLEADSNPPTGSNFESHLLLWPYPFSILTQDEPSLLAGKIHAVLCRPYTKGRDVFDLLWYMGRGTQPNIKLLANALKQAGPWKNQKIKISSQWVINQLITKIENTDFDAIRADVRRFLRETDSGTLLALRSDTVLSAIKSKLR
jgi:predicted nucleotidyltransferase component of viral defense system